MPFSISDLQFETLAEVGWIVVDDALSSEQWRSWGAWLHQWSSRLRPAEIGRASTQQIQNEVRGDQISWLEPSDPDPHVQQMLNSLESLRKNLAEELRIALRRFEAHLALYPQGRGYDVHIDQHRGQGHRKITFILYLNENWILGDGGELEFYPKTGAEPCIIEPRGGRLVLFQSDRFPHGVRRANRPRKSLTGWFRDDDAILGE